MRNATPTIPDVFHYAPSALQLHLPGRHDQEEHAGSRGDRRSAGTKAAVATAAGAGVAAYLVGTRRGRAIQRLAKRKATHAGYYGGAFYQGFKQGRTIAKKPPIPFVPPSIADRVLKRPLAWAFGKAAKQPITHQYYQTGIRTRQGRSIVERGVKQGYTTGYRVGQFERDTVRKIRPWLERRQQQAKLRAQRKWRKFQRKLQKQFA
jgi:hypothetical protein